MASQAPYDSPIVGTKPVLYGRLLLLTVLALTKPVLYGRLLLLTVITIIVISLIPN